MYCDNVSIVKSRGFLLGMRSDIGFEKDIKNVNLLSLFFTFPGQVGNESVKMFCESLYFQDLLNCNHSGNTIWLRKKFT